MSETIVKIKSILLLILKGNYQRAWYNIKRKKYLQVDTVEYPVSLYGNPYNGYRVYDKVIKEKENPIVYSFGIGEDLDFCERINKSFNPEIFAFDPTPRAIDYVKSHYLYNQHNFHFTPVGLSDKDEKEMFYLPINEKSVSGSAIIGKHLKNEGFEVEMRCISTLAKERGHNHIDLLKMDVEGSEFKFVEGLRNCPVLIDQICMEIHDRGFKDGIDLLKLLLVTMRDLGYLLISISTSEEELTFLKKSVVK